jgi:hypothetical protein
VGSGGRGRHRHELFRPGVLPKCGYAAER